MTQIIFLVFLVFGCNADVTDNDTFNLNRAAAERFASAAESAANAAERFARDAKAAENEFDRLSLSNSSINAAVKAVKATESAYFRARLIMSNRANEAVRKAAYFSIRAYRSAESVSPYAPSSWSQSFPISHPLSRYLREKQEEISMQGISAEVP